MLAVQKYLRDGKSLEDLTTELGIEVKPHPTHPLVILTYSQIDSPKTHPVVMDCRGLVLEVGSWEVVARCMTRFFNEGEALDITKNFLWDGCRADAKEDGSLVHIFQYAGEFFTTTRGSWGDGICGFSGKTWRELIIDAMPDRLREYLHDPNKLRYLHSTLVCEFCSVHNKVVRMYREPVLYLLAITHKDGEMHPSHVDEFAADFGMKRPASWTFENIQKVRDFIDCFSLQDPTWEGLVLRDSFNMRIKVKSSAYVSLHMMRGEGDNLFNPKYILPWVLRNEGDELKTYFPEVTNRYAEVETHVRMLFMYLVESWKFAKDIEDQKEFALAVTKGEHATPFSSVLFRLKKEGTIQDEAALKKAFNDAEDLILKILKDKLKPMTAPKLPTPTFAIDIETTDGMFPRVAIP